jgi:hypothetical protein
VLRSAARTQVFGTRSPLGFKFGSNTYESTNANSVYNSLQAQVERRTRDFTFLVAYTFSTMNYSNLRLSRALSSFDAIHNFVASYSYMIPFDRAFHGAPARLTQGWSISVITRFATGFPITITQSGDRSLTGAGGVDHSDFIGPLVITPDVRATLTHRYFNKSAFSSEQLGTMGNSNQRFLHGPGINNWDLALQKLTRIRESISIQFRAEFFNAM